MIYSSQFGGGLALGSIVQGIGLAEPQYVACDGRPVLRASYPRLSALFPIGRLTGTVRTLPAIPPAALVSASPTYFVASAAAGATGVQYSTDGVTWLQTAVSTPAIGVASLIFAGTRWLCTSTTTGNYPIATTGDNPNSTWASLTGVGQTPSTVPRCGIAYSASVGRAAFLFSGAHAAIYTLDNGATNLVTRTASGISRTGICWTGSKFIAVSGSTITTSADGITWADEALPEAAGNFIASNGAGVVVISGLGLLVSTDHGATWFKTAIPGVPVDWWQVHYSGDRFFVPTTLGVVMSLDGKAWFLEPQLVQSRTAASMFARKGTAIVQVQATTTAYSFTESATAFNAPLLQSFAPVATGNPVPLAPNFIKAL